MNCVNEKLDLISIVITTFKGESGILRCVSSAMAQDYQNFEVIVVDDNGAGTPEQINTYNLLEEYINYDNFCYIKHEKNKNGSAARNTGIRNAKGKYIAFLDDDDYLHEDSIRLRYQKLKNKQQDYGIVFASFCQYVGDKLDMECVYEFDGNIMKDYLQQKIHSPSSVIMIRKEIIDVVGYWDESFVRHQDWEYITRILSKYKACAVKMITVDRIMTWRNNAKTPELFEQHRLFYLGKMNPYIEMLPTKDKKEVFYKHYMDIGKNFIKYKKFKKALYYAKKSGELYRALKDYLIGMLRYSIKKIDGRA